jgi:hypothetical protein
MCLWQNPEAWRLWSSDVPRILDTQLNAQDEIYAAGLQGGITFVPWKIALRVRYL